MSESDIGLSKIVWQGTIVSIQPRTTVWRYRIDNRTHRHIGYSFLFFATEMVKDNKIKLLELNGVAPTRENVANKTYPYAAEFYAVTAGTDNPNAERLIEWILSEQGQELIEKTGYTPLY